MHLPHILSIASLTEADIERLARDACAEGHGRDACPFAHDSHAGRHWLAAFGAAANMHDLALA